MRGSISTCVTRDPNLAKHWASSQPIGPPPRTTSRGGNALRFQTVSEVRQPISASPGIGGTKGCAPAAMTIARVVSTRLPVSLFTSTVQGEVIFASPCRHSTPSSV